MHGEYRDAVVADAPSISYPFLRNRGYSARCDSRETPKGAELALKRNGFGVGKPAVYKRYPGIRRYKRRPVGPESPNQNIGPGSDEHTLSVTDNAQAGNDAARRALRKVPQVTVLFWIVKVLTTAMGETTSDYLVYHINPYIAVAVGGFGLAAALLLQFAVRYYIVWVYWLAVAMVAIFGTMVADVLHVVLGIPYLVSTVFFAVALTLVFVSWYTSEKTLSIHSIDNPRREVFYWTTVMTTFALGTAAGDMTASTLGLGYLASGILFAALIAVPAVAWYRFGMNPIFAFWFAYILTRPLGASFADWMGKPPSWSGLGWGTGPVSVVLAVMIVGFVGYLEHTRIDFSGERRES